jgi:glutamyl-tRNA reductase
MPLLATGISHHTAPLETREKIAIARDEYADQVKALCARGGIEEVVLISTCNRTEVYSVGTNQSRVQVRQWLQSKGHLSDEEMQAHCYVREREQAVRHLFRVAGGLESLVLGESQILGQLKEAWQMAHDAGGVGKVLDRLFQHAFATSKKIRSKTRIGEHPVSVAYTTVMLAKHIFGDLASKTVIMVGAGEMIELCGRHLQEKGVTSLIIANRSIERARDLAAQYGATAVTLAGLPDVLNRADILISSTASTEPVLYPDAVQAALKQRRHQPMFLVDIAVPRDIHPDVGKLDDVYLYTIDDLQKVVDENISRRNEAAEAAGADVAGAVDEFMRWLNSARASVYLQKLHKHARSNSEELVTRAMRRLEAGKDPEQVMTQLANTLAKRILHLPSTRLRQAAEDQDDELLHAANRLFEPEDEP